MSENIIEVRNLTRRYGDLVAVDHINFNVIRGEVFGFLGPNGAGKTTTISMLTTLLKPTDGTATVGGYDIVHQQDRVREEIGIVFQEPSLDERLTAAENLEFHAVLYNVPAAERRERIMMVLRMVQLEGRANDQVERFSGGMKRRLEIARGLLHTPRVLFLDEPTIGLDPQTRRSLWDYILGLREQTDITIFMTTHYMDEAEFCDRIAIIDQGHIVALDTPESLKGQVGGDVVTVTAPNGTGELASFARQNDLPFAQRQNEVRFEVEDGARFIPRLVRDFPGAIESINLRRPTLDDVFLKLTGRTIRELELDEKDIARNRFQRRLAMRGRGRRR
ncbi:MAG: ATP-binding cassette domain-containing protein [Ardenticatenaceae bacterium]|nr:ATP-binding cassette domain-containing protein [Ardenticatenaceae bacterium]HBY94383.1 ABC transporter ATP-binding protein [Chloroflexota bacterium]